MLHRAKQIKGAVVLASGDEVGKVDELYFDDEKWVLRYFTVVTGGWLSRHTVLISPYAVTTVDFIARAISVELTREQVTHSPDIDTDKPVSRQQEAEYHRYFGYPPYWGYATYWPWGAAPLLQRPHPPLTEPSVSARDAEEAADIHLRSAEEVRGYHIQATDDRLGHIEDFLVDDDSWAMRYLVIDTRNWWPGRHVLVAPQWVRKTDWLSRTLTVDLSRLEVEQSPEYDPSQMPSRHDEQALYRHYGRSSYWG